MKLHTLVATLIAGFTALSAQATTMTNSSNDELTKVVYGCKGKQNLDVIYINTSKGSYAVISQVDELIPMELTKGASGANYKPINPDYKYELQTKGTSAELLGENDKPILTECISQ